MRVNEWIRNFGLRLLNFILFILCLLISISVFEFIEFCLKKYFKILDNYRYWFFIKVKIVECFCFF